MTANHPTWTVFGVFDDNKQAYVTIVKAKDWPSARSKVLREAAGVILIAGIVPGVITPVDDVTEQHVPICGRGHTITVTSVRITEREISIPDRCGKCKADTHRANALIETNLVARTWGVHLSPNGKDLAHARGGKSQDTKPMLETVYLSCTKCGHVIWDGLNLV